ncbi:NAD(P)-dependent oxidoreductase [Streptomyces sp. NPDC059783]|uniref:NAD(P)-dependent oxidoreductase n=1 Tax=Streptomyces sp. NPDC059783 TaxID=3346944 RepID=UPI00365BA3A5
MPEQPVLLVLDADPSPRLGALTGRVRVRRTDGAGLAAALAEADALLVWDTGSDAVRGAWPGSGRRPAWVHVAGPDVDRVVCPELAAGGTVLTRARGVFERPVAEYVAGLLLAFAQDFPGSPGSRRGRTPVLLAGSRAVVVGAGPVGRETARLLMALGVEVALVGRTARRTIHGMDDLDRLAAAADRVVAALPPTPLTRGLFDRRFFGLMQPSAVFVNVGSAASVAEDELAAAVRDRWIAGAALDGPAGAPAEVPGLLVTPRRAGAVAGRHDRLAEQFVALYERWAAGEELPHPVDPALGYTPGP